MLLSSAIKKLPGPAPRKFPSPGLDGSVSPSQNQQIRLLARKDGSLHFRTESIWTVPAPENYQSNYHYQRQEKYTESSLLLALESHAKVILMAAAEHWLSRLK